MKLLTIVTNKFGHSGITSSIMNYYRYIDKSNMDIDFVIPNVMPTLLRNEIERNGGRIFELKIRNKNPLFYIVKLIKIAKAGKYDIVHAHGNSSTLALEMFAAKLAGIKIRISHSRNTTCSHTIIDKFLRPAFNRLYTHGFACGYDAGKWLFNGREFTIINNGNDTLKYRYNGLVRDEVRSKYKIGENVLLGHVGTFNFQKNHEFIIDIFNELLKISPDYRLMLVGDGANLESIKLIASKLKIVDKIIFTGQSSEVDKLMQAMDILILPSRYEGFPNVIIEAQMACLQSIISDRITKDVKITNFVQFLPLESGAKAWAMMINGTSLNDRQSLSDITINQISNAGYNISDNAKSLKDIYKNLLTSLH